MQNLELTTMHLNKFIKIICKMIKLYPASIFHIEEYMIFTDNKEGNIQSATGHVLCYLLLRTLVLF